MRRFEKLLQIGDLNGNTVMDLGCGRGDLLLCIDKQFSNVTYVGIDMMNEFVAAAEGRHSQRNKTFFFQADFTTDGLPQVDYVLASGALSYQTSNWLFPFTMIRKMYDSAAKGIAFNLLDADRFTSNTILKAYDRNEILSYCQRLCASVEILTGYLEDDFTILMRKL